MPVTSRLKRLYLSLETAKQMRWHTEGKRDSEDRDIMLHPADSEDWEALDPDIMLHPTGSEAWEALDPDIISMMQVTIFKDAFFSIFKQYCLTV
jgi:hypothetical protein